MLPAPISRVHRIGNGQAQAGDQTDIILSIFVDAGKKRSTYIHSWGITLFVAFWGYVRVLGINCIAIEWRGHLCGR